jgi:hypothetical protein
MEQGRSVVLTSVQHMSPFNRLLHLHAAAAFDRQLRLGDWVGESEWELDLEAGRLVYEGAQGPTFRIQLLGLESPGTGWLWAWEQPLRRWDEALLRAAHQLRALGEEQEIRALAAPRLREGEVEGLALALVAGGLCRATGMFRCQVPSGVLYCLLVEPSLPPLESLPAWRAAEVFPQVLEQIPLVDPPLAFGSYLRALGLQPEVREAQVRGTGRAGDRITATFDEKRQLLGLHAEMIL